MDLGRYFKKVDMRAATKLTNATNVVSQEVENNQRLMMSGDVHFWVSYKWMQLTFRPRWCTLYIYIYIYIYISNVMFLGHAGAHE